MLSVVIATQDSERALLPTLAALVAGAVAGLVREVIIADASSRDATVTIADEARLPRAGLNAPARDAPQNGSRHSARVLAALPAAWRRA